MNPPPFAALNRIPFESNTLRLDWTSNFSLDGVSPPGGRNLYATITYSPSEALDRQMQDILVQEARSVNEIVGLQTGLVIQPIYEAAIKNGKNRGGNAAGIESDGPLTVVLFSTRWVNAEDDDKANELARSWVKRAVDAAAAAGKHNRWLYINYASKDQDPFAGYGVENRRRLESIQKAVDPKGIFSSRGLCRGYFKLS
ncbi:hypothetical protein NW762_006510 [Fusarium torreyae]|uniref:FAD binding domain-containing protein n=1 Tax=Fusarium torreyae TaxID=1237075 RepID=A0A9W8VEF3_9HYPO|nr:hypothetical protein NW762_006510 [Fusarium torreyae]